MVASAPSGYGKFRRVVYIFLGKTKSDYTINLIRVRITPLHHPPHSTPTNPPPWQSLCLFASTGPGNRTSSPSAPTPPPKNPNLSPKPLPFASYLTFNSPNHPATTRKNPQITLVKTLGYPPPPRQPPNHKKKGTYRCPRYHFIQKSFKTFSHKPSGVFTEASSKTFNLTVSN